MLRCLFWILVSFLVVSCSDPDHIEYDNFSIALNTRLNDISVINDDMYIVGGDLWESGQLLKSDDGENFNIELDTSTSLTSILPIENEIFSVGFDCFLFKKSVESGNCEFRRLPGNIILRSISKAQNEIVVTGGHGYGEGYIYNLNDDLDVDSVHTFQFNINGVDFSPSLNTFFAVGFGVILQYNRDELTWNSIGIEGDFYKDIQFVDDQIAYIAGQSGQILKTVDGGVQWKEVLGNSNVSLPKGLNKIHFLDANVGAVVGNDGIIIYTKDGGQSWTESQLKGAPDLYSVYVNPQGEAYVCGYNGFIARVSL